MLSQKPMYQGDVKIHGKMAFDIIFDAQTFSVGEWSVIGTLRDCADRVRDTVNEIGQEVMGITVGSFGSPPSERPTVENN